jgi:hypothetical protein
MPIAVPEFNIISKKHPFLAETLKLSQSLPKSPHSSSPLHHPKTPSEPLIAKVERTFKNFFLKKQKEEHSSLWIQEDPWTQYLQSLEQPKPVKPASFFIEKEDAFGYVPIKSLIPIQDYNGKHIVNQTFTKSTSPSKSPLSEYMTSG